MYGCLVCVCVCASCSGLVSEEIRSLDLLELETMWVLKTEDAAHCSDLSLDLGKFLSEYFFITATGIKLEDILSVKTILFVSIL